MVQRVYLQAQKSNAKRVVVATDDARIQSVVEDFGGDCVMTRADHVSGTDRLQETAALLQLTEEEIIVNVQGDEPLIPPAVINQVAHNLSAQDTAAAATLSEPITDVEDFLNANAVKVVAATGGHALYFSRAPVPWPRDHFAKDRSTLPNNFPAQRHIGIYAYRVGLLNHFVNWPAGRLESIESLEQLRILENGAFMHVDQVCQLVPGGVDTQQDLDKVRRLLQEHEPK